MTLVTIDFDGYAIKYASFKYSVGVSKVISSISLFNGMINVGVLWFVDTYPVPYENTYVNNILKINYHISHFNDIINTLRYEKPLRLEYDASKGEGALVSKPWTSHEPVGEQEGV